MNKTIIFSDGSSRGNPGEGGFGAILFENGFVKEVGGREDKTTNNRMEIMAVIKVLKISKEKNISIFTDSSYLVNAMTSWIFAWQKNGFKKKSESGISEDVLNQDLFKELIDLVKDKKITWNKIPGHSGIEANERCDEIATSFADKKEIKLFSGKKEDYKISLDINLNNLQKSKSTKNQKAYSYVSFINGEIFIDKTWEECKKRVSNVKGVRYKKSVSEKDEKKIIEEFNNL